MNGTGCRSYYSSLSESLFGTHVPTDQEGTRETFSEQIERNDFSSVKELWTQPVSTQINTSDNSAKGADRIDFVLNRKCSMPSFNNNSNVTTKRV